MALSEIYVDPSIAADSGTGTIGDPYGDLEYAVEQTTFDTTNGTRVNIKSGSDEVLAAELGDAMDNVVTTVAWAPSATAPAIFQGYTATAGDGGIGGISGNALVSIINDATKNGVYFVDMHLHNTGANIIADINDNGGFIRCELNNGTAGGISADAECHVEQCYLYDISGIGVTSFGGYVGFCRFENGPTNDFTACIQSVAADVAVIYRNLFKVDGTTDAIQISNKFVVENNSIWSNGGSGTGIGITGANRTIYKIANNIVEGFSGVGGIGFDLGEAASETFLYGGNSAYNNETNFNNPANAVTAAQSNETLTQSAFTDAANSDFSPVDTGLVKEGSVPTSFPS